MKKFKSLLQLVALLQLLSCVENSSDKHNVSGGAGTAQQQIFSNVDSVFLVVFKDIPRIVNDDSNYVHPDLVLNGTLNDSLVQKKKKINDHSQLNAIFEDFVGDDEEINLVKCFITDRAIVYYRKGIANYIKISFECKSFNVSDSSFENFRQLRDSAYTNLDKYFKVQGL